MKLPNIKRILREDLGPNVPNWTEGIIGPVNSFMEAVYQTLNKNVTFTENVASFFVELIIKTDVSSVFETSNFLNQIKTRPRGVLVCQVYEKSTFTPIAVTGIAWSTDGTNVSIFELPGLSASQTYVVRLLIF